MFTKSFIVKEESTHMKIRRLDRYLTLVQKSQEF